MILSHSNKMSPQLRKHDVTGTDLAQHHFQVPESANKAIVAMDFKLNNFKLKDREKA